MGMFTKKEKTYKIIQESYLKSNNSSFFIKVIANLTDSVNLHKQQTVKLISLLNKITLKSLQIILWGVRQVYLT